MDRMWGRLGGVAALALAVTAGGAWAGDADGAWAEDGSVSEAPFEGESPISGEGVEGEVTVTEAGGSALPPGFCDDCEESGEIVEEVLVEASPGAAGGRQEREGDGWLRSVPRTAKAERSDNLCTSPEFYVAWLCEWQGFPRP
jgi:hypothetical protein